MDDREYRKQFYPAVDQRQALDDRQEHYYVPIYQRPELAPYDVARVLADAIDFSSGTSVQLLSGYKGSGKTSELLRLADELRGTGRSVVYLDIEDYFNTELPLELGAFPVALAAGFAEGTGHDLKHAATIRERLGSFLKRVDLEPTLGIAGPGGISAELKVSLQQDSSFIGRVRSQLESNRVRFRRELHDFFADAGKELSTDRAPVFIVDSIDHYRGRSDRFKEVRESVERAFAELYDELCIPNMHVIYTVPVYVQSPLGVRHDVLNIKVATPEGSPVPEGISVLRDVLEARAPERDLERLLAATGDRLLRQSGGLFRDLLRLTGQVLLTAGALPASADDLSRAEMVLRNDYEAALSAEKIAILEDISRSHRLAPREDDWSHVMDLMTAGAILKYPNGTQAWYDVHPLVGPLLA
jgi:hypothetical protein